MSHPTDHGRALDAPAPTPALPEPPNTAAVLAAFRDELIAHGVPRHVADDAMLDRNRRMEALVVSL